MSRKFNYYDLRTGRKAWRSQVDFYDDFFKTDEEREVASDHEINSFIKFFRKYDSYTNQEHIKGERNRFSFKEETVQIEGFVHAHGFSFKTKEIIERYLNRKVGELEEKIQKNMEEKFGGLVRIFNRDLFEVTTDGDIIKIEHPLESYGFNYWVNYGNEWGWRTSSDIDNLYMKPSIWDEKPSLEDVVMSLGVKDYKKVADNIRKIKPIDVVKEIIGLMGGEENLVAEIKKLVPESDREIWEKENKRAEEAEKERIENLTESEADNYGVSSHKQIRFN